RAGRLVVAVRADHARLEAEHCAHLVDVQGFPLRQVLDDVDEDDLGVVAARQLQRAGRAHVAAADHGDLAPPLERRQLVPTGYDVAQTRTPSLSMIASATSLVPTEVGSSRVGFMS